MPRRFLLSCLAILALTALAVAAPEPSPTAPAELLARADALRAEGSHQLARELYEQLAELEDAAPELRAAARVRAADSLWRERAGREPMQQAELRLRRLVEDLEEQPPLRAEAAESLGELRVELGMHWQEWRPVVEPWIVARDIWGRSTDPAAAERYLELNFKIAEFLVDRVGPIEPPPIPLPRPRPGRGVVAPGRMIIPPLPPPQEPTAFEIAREALRNILRASNEPAVRGRALYLMGRLHLNDGDRAQEEALREERREQAIDYFRQAIAIEPRHEFTDDAIWQLSMHFNNVQRFPDAVELWRQLLEIYRPGESEYHEQAGRLLEVTTQPRIDLGLARAFAPGSHIHVQLNYRNVERATLRLERIEPADYLAHAPFIDQDPERMRSLPGRLVHEREVEGLIDEGRFMPRALSLYLEPLEPGIYRAAVDSPRLSERVTAEPFFVSALAVAAKTHDGAVEIFVADAADGQPVAEAEVIVAVWGLERRSRASRHILLHELRAVTDADGRARVQLPPPDDATGALKAVQQFIQPHEARTFVFARRGEEWAALQQWGDYRSMHGGEMIRHEQLSIYATSDRPAYRPGEPIRFKAIVRRMDGERPEIPDAASYRVRVRDARGEVVHDATLPINDYGTLAGELTLGREVALGMLMLELLEDAPAERVLAASQLARLEEYRLPEFIVEVEPAAGPFRLGTPIPFSVRAEYYHGGPLAGATAEIVVHRAPFRPRWFPPFRHDWLLGTVDGSHAMRHPGIWPVHEPEEVVLSTTVTLDEDGAARLEAGALSAEEVAAAREEGLWGYTYRVEARVTDLSRREVSGSGSIKAALTQFKPYLEPERYLFLPGDPVRVELRTLDPNEQPVAATGLARIFRREWNPEKKSAKGEPEPGYDDTLLFTQPASTDAQGRGRIEFTPERDGYYLVKFVATDAFGEQVEGETTVFVAGRDTTAVGYRSGGVEIILDQRSYARGETIQALVVTRRPGVAVWLGVEAETILQERIVRMEGTAQLVAIEVGEDFEPNIHLTALSMYDYSGFRDQKMVVVPPERRLLEIEIEPDQEEYRPGDPVEVRLRALDHEGRPAGRVELSLAVADDAVWAIQDEVAPDIRSHFWGRTRPLGVNASASAERYTIEFWRPIPGRPGQFERVLREEIPVTKSGVGLGGDNGSYLNMRMAGGMAVAESAPAALMPSPGMAMDMAVGDAPAEPRLRTDFSSTAHWVAQLETDADGTATARFTMPDSLTRWRIVSRAVDRDTRVGQQTETVRTNKPIMVRPQVPRFFIEGDTAVVSAVIANRTEEDQRVTARIELGGLRLEEFILGRPLVRPEWLEAITSPVAPAYREVELTVPAGSQRRVDWTVHADAPGTATIRMTALATVDSDAAERSYIIHEYGIEQFIAQATEIREPAGDAERTLTLRVPEAIREGSATLLVWVEPTLARAMVNALPYLVEFPYGCTEQTLSRFVPAVITGRVVRQLGLTLPDLEEKLPEVVRAGLARLYDFQHEDGGWGWWRDDQSQPYMTAYIVQGLAEAAEAGVDVRRDVVTRAAGYLRLQLVRVAEEEDLTAFMLYALAQARELTGEDELTAAAHERLWPRRERLNPYTRALFALACHLSGRGERAAILARNMRNGVEVDPDNGTARWGAPGLHYRWSQGAIEATSFSMRALLAIEPDSELIEMAMRWLVNNRRGNRWKNTRDTAIAIGALADYITVRGEARPDWTAEVLLNGEPIQTLSVGAGNVFEFDGLVVVRPELLRAGENTLTIRRRGSGTLYASAWLSYFTREERIEPAGKEAFVARRFWRIQMLPTAGGPWRAERQPLEEGDPLVPGDRIEVELELEAKNDYEYIVVEDFKAAGLEPVELQSGGVADGTIWAHRELRDERVAFFLTHMPQGRHTLRYELRAETPGVFHALPCQVHAMYVPEIRANSGGERITITEGTE